MVRWEVGFLCTYKRRAFLQFRNTSLHETYLVCSSVVPNSEHHLCLITLTSKMPVSLFSHSHVEFVNPTYIVYHSLLDLSSSGKNQLKLITKRSFELVDDTPLCFRLLGKSTIRLGKLLTLSPVSNCVYPLLLFT